MNKYKLPLQTVNGELKQMDGFEAHWRTELSNETPGYMSWAKLKERLRKVWQEATKQAILKERERIVRMLSDEMAGIYAEIADRLERGE